MKCRGLEDISFPPAPCVDAESYATGLSARVTPANLGESRRIWAMIDEGYLPIDWHLDFKSGFRWNERTWYRDIRFLNIRGADVKVPWELSRLQHLPQMALEYGRTRDPALLREIRNQMLDWIACNPPRFGVNWFSTMDVAIRVANMVVAFDLAVCYGAAFDPDFTKLLQRSVYEHALHIEANLEWSADFRGNHYLSNIAGLLFAAMYLDEKVGERATWIAFAVEELVTAVEEQFYEDGTNFEASTSYHRLSAEMVVQCLALLQRMPGARDGIPEWFWSHVVRMADFSRWITKPDGSVVQVGDNDSGRFLKVFPPYDMLTCSKATEKYASLDGYDELPDDAAYPDECHLDHSEFLGMAAALSSRDSAASGGINNQFMRAFTLALAGPGFVPLAPAIKNSQASQEMIVPRLGTPDRKESFALLDTPSEISVRAFAGFGLYVLRSDRFQLFIRCGQLGQNGIGGHAHNDQLSFELTRDGKTIFPDPGTYLYTPMPERRNAYRSVTAHNGPRPVGGEPGLISVGLFRILDSWQAECLAFSEREFLGVMRRGSKSIHRRISVQQNRLVIEDWANGCALSSPVFPNRLLAHSTGYGMILRTLAATNTAPETVS